MKLCVFQGTFNPIHNAHIRVAKYVCDKYKFDKFLVIPASVPPHKNCDTDISEHRFNMVKIAFEDFKGIEVSDIEYKRQGKSYTYLTICELYDKYNISGKINFIIGTDAFRNIETWYEADKLKKQVKFIVFKREKKFDKSDFDNLKNEGYDFSFENLEFEDISSSQIRQKIKNGDSTDKYIPQKIKNYMVIY